MAAKKEEKTLNQKITDLDNKVEWFDGDDFKLEEATGKYKETLTLAKEIEEDLNNLKNEIEVLAEDFTK
jgi:exonuclease VII small subunit